MNGTEPKRSEGQRATKPVSYVTGENPPLLRRIKLGGGEEGGAGGGGWGGEQSEGRKAWKTGEKQLNPSSARPDLVLHIAGENPAFTYEDRSLNYQH